MSVTSFMKKANRDGKSDARQSSATAAPHAAPTKIATTIHDETSEKSALLSTQKVAPAWSPKVPKPGGSRSCTDLPCLLIFVVCVGALGFVMKSAYKNGDPRRLFHVRNYKGQICGEDLPDKPFGFWCSKPRGGALSITTLADVGVDMKHPICVASCPSTDTESVECFDELTGGTRVATTYKTSALGGRYCYPQAGQALLGKLRENFAHHPVEKFMEDTVASVKKGWKILLIGVGVSILLAYFYIIFLECCAGFMIYSCLILTFLVSLVCGVLVLGTSLSSIEQFKFLQSMGSLGWTGGGLDGIPGSGDGTIDTAIGVGFLLVAFIVLCFTCCFQQAVKVCIQATETTAVFLTHSPSMFLEPLLNLIARSALWVLMMFGFAYLLSTLEVDSDITHKFDWQSEDMAKVIFYIIMWMWLNDLCTAQSHFVISNAAGRWYFTEHNSQGMKVMLTAGGVCGCCPLIIQGYCSSIWHFGSLCLGSLLVSIFRPFKMVLSLILYAELIIDKSLRWIFCCCGMGKCCSCCVACFRRFFGYFGKTAFINLAVNPEPMGFCGGLCCAYWEAAKHGVELMYETKHNFHLEEMDTYQGATWLFTFLGMMLVGAGSSSLAVLMAAHVPPYNDTLSIDYIQDPSTLAIFCFLIGAVIALCFMLVFDTAWDALLVCMAYDMKDRRENPPPRKGQKTMEPSQNTGFFSSLLCSRKAPVAAPMEDAHVPVYAHSQMEFMITGKRTPLKADGMGSFATSSKARTFSTQH